MLDEVAVQKFGCFFPNILCEVTDLLYNQPIVKCKDFEADDAKLGTLGKVVMLPYNGPWESEFFEEKEVRVYYKVINDTIMLLTVKARYGKGFPKKEASQ